MIKIIIINNKRQEQKETRKCIRERQKYEAKKRKDANIRIEQLEQTAKKNNIVIKGLTIESRDNKFT